MMHHLPCSIKLYFGSLLIMWLMVGVNMLKFFPSFYRFYSEESPTPPRQQLSHLHCFKYGIMGNCMPTRECNLAGGISLGDCGGSSGSTTCCKRVYDDKILKYDCGVSTRRFERKGKIVNGSDSAFAEYPWQVYISLAWGYTFCGGTLLNNEWVVTAAHCVISFPINRIQVRLGEYDLSQMAEPLPHKELGIRQKIIHHGFNYMGENDIALLKLKRAVRFAPNIIPICLPDVSHNYEDTVGVVTGWGATSWDGPPSLILQKVAMPILSNKECKSMTDGYDPSFLCAGYLSGGYDACKGDSGSPLQVKNAAGKEVLVGIVSWGKNCAQKGSIGIYTNVKMFLPWIFEKTGIS